MTSPDLIGLAPVMRRLAIRRKAVMRLISAGKLVAHKVGRQWRFDPRDVDAYVEAAKVRPAVAKGTARPRTSPVIAGGVSKAAGLGADRYL